MEIDGQIIEHSGFGRKFLCDTVASLSESYDYCYVRFQFFCPFVQKMLAALKARGTRTVMEIPTYPYEPELRAQGLRGLPKLWCDRLFRSGCARYIDAFVTIACDCTELFGRECIPISNGIDFDSVAVRSPQPDDGVIDLLAVAMMAPWQAYDRVIRGMGEYLAGGGSREVRLHLVGDGVSLPGYRSLAANLGVERQVEFHGRRYGEELSALYDRCDCAVSCLGMHRKKVTGLYSLKCIEAVARGIPVICTANELTVSRGDFVCKLVVPDDDSPISIPAVIDFYDRVIATKDPEELARSVRAYGLEHCDMRVTQRPVIDWLLSKKE